MAKKKAEALTRELAKPEAGDSARDASLLLQQGESLAYVKDQLGHSSIQMSLDVYGHPIPA